MDQGGEHARPRGADRMAEGDTAAVDVDLGPVPPILGQGVAIGEYLRGERTEESLLPTLSAKLWQYARRQKSWLRKLGHAVS